MSKFNELVTKLREIFQIDRPELDFGVYRILNARADEINDYLENRLKEKVSAALSAKAKGDTESITKDLIAELRDEYGKRAFDDVGNLVDEEALASDTGKRLQDILNSSKGVADNENAVFSHLLTFFSRYYDQGDFISQRRYKGDTYAIPYAGEEVMLHWANKDQYYIKSGENFSNYSFKLEDGRVVHFRLVAADTAKDNRKDNDKDRLFVLAESRTIVRIDDEGDEYDDEIIPIEETATTDADGNATTELIIRFDYKAVSKGTKQDKLISEAVASTLELDWVSSSWSELASRAPTEKNPKRTLLEKHLINYTAKNTADYFIHKNLGKFLRGELDFYIKNEVMNLDDVQDAEAFSDIEKNLRMIQCLRSIASDLITFLAQLEDFQKKLWTKKKFVADCNFYISLNLIDESYYPQILLVESLWNEWILLGFVSKETERSVDFLKSNKALLVNTNSLPGNLSHKIIGNINDFDKCTSGLLLHSDNYQGICLLNEKYRNKIKYIYIDPPYNTNSTPIIYKNEYKRSSWATLMMNRLSSSMKLLQEDGVKTIAIDDSELVNLCKVLDEVAPEHTLSKITVVHNPKGSITKNFNRVHEYALFLTPDGHNTIARTLEENSSPRKMRRWGENSLRTERRLSFYPIYVKNNSIVGIGDVPDDEFHPAAKNELQSDGTIAIWPIDQNGIERRWNFGLDSIEENVERIAIIETDDGLDLFLTHEKTVPKTVWSGGEFDAGKYGNSLLIDLMGSKMFDFPKSINLVKKCVELTASSNNSDIIMDFFAGSGTTGHAVIDLNRGDDGNRSFILIEQGEYFEKVTKPRILKAAYSSEWKSGQPTNIQSNGSYIFKILQLESYEDTLNNILLSRSSDQKDLLMTENEINEDFLIKYMLDFDSKKSMLSVNDFIDPFSKKMNITVDSAGSFIEKKINLIETFNYLIGLTVTNYEYQLEQGYVRIEGILPSGENTLILWRDCNKIDYVKLGEWENRLNIGAKDNPYDVIYINGDHNLSEIYSPTKEEGGETSVRVIRSIEPEFLSRMFAEEEI